MNDEDYTNYEGTPLTLKDVEFLVASRGYTTEFLPDASGETTVVYFVEGTHTFAKVRMLTVGATHGATEDCVKRIIDAYQQRKRKEAMQP